jgi:N utilization substance protein B
MAISRNEARRLSMVILYQIEIYKDRKIEYNVEDVIKENVEIQNEFINELVNGVVEHQTEIDELANKYMKDWTIDRIDKTGAAIMRIAIYELKHTNTPEIVVINEALELAKNYSDDSVRKIINATLDKIIKE